MKKMTVFVLLAACLLLTGCDTISSNDDLFALPQTPGVLKPVQDLVRKMEQEGVEWARPRSGAQDRRSEAQMANIDGDEDEEALLFVKAPQPQSGIEVHLYKKSGVTGTFEPFGIIPLEGEEVYRVDYLDMDGDQSNELVIALQSGDSGLRALQIFSILDGQVTERFKGMYTGIAVTDLNSDRIREVCLIQYDSADVPGQVDLYRLTDMGVWELSGSAAMSLHVSQLLRISAGGLEGGGSALYVTGEQKREQETWRVVDVFTMMDGQFVNLSLDERSQESEKTKYRTNLTETNLDLYPADMDGNGVMDLPQPAEIDSQSTANRFEIFWGVDWQSLRATGLTTIQRNLFTWHNFLEGWYIELPMTWRDDLIVRRENLSNNEKKVVFSLRTDMSAGTYTDLFSLYTLSGENWESFLDKGARFALAAEKDDMVVACELAPSAYLTYTEADFEEWFSWIKTESSTRELIVP